MLPRKTVTMQQPDVGTKRDDRSDVSVVDLDAAVLRLDGDWDLLSDLAGFFFEDGRDAFARLQTSIDAANWPEAVRAAHSIKGLFRTFDASAAATVAAECEASCRAESTAVRERLPELEANLHAVETALRQFQANR